MSANVVNQMPFLRTSRNFPEEIGQFTVEVNKAYVDTANAVNNRTISLFPSDRPAINGESWFQVGNLKQQGFRQIYPFTVTPPATVPIPILHRIMIVTPAQFVRGFGSYTDGTNTYGLIWGSTVAIAGQISFFISPTSIVFVIGAGAPVPTSGVVILEWLSQP
jgi:hypothetical protein